MKAIYKIVDKRTGREFGYNIAEDIQHIPVSFDDIKHENGRYMRYKYVDNLVTELVEETDDANRRLAYYLWPQSERIEYLESCFNNVQEKGYVKRINRVIDWLVQTYPDKCYSFKIESNDAGQIVANVLKNMVLDEIYLFKSGKNPCARYCHNSVAAD